MHNNGDRSVFILSGDGRDERFPAVRIAFERYEKYLREHKVAFPSHAYELATSPWFYDPRDHRSPHDGRLEMLQIVDTPDEAQVRRCSISLRLLGAYRDGYIEISYPRVISYSLQSFMAGKVTSHGDWSYDEFRLSERGHLVHESDWTGAPRAQRRSFSWIIEASDVDYRWIPRGSE